MALIDWSVQESPTTRADVVEAVLRCKELRPAHRRKVLVSLFELQQTDLARSIEVTRQMVAAAIDGARSAKVETALAEALGVERERLFPEHFENVVAGAETIQEETD